MFTFLVDGYISIWFWAFLLAAHITIKETYVVVKFVYAQSTDWLTGLKSNSVFQMTTAHFMAVLTSSFLPTILHGETAFTLSYSQTEKQVHRFDQNTDVLTGKAEY